MADTHRKNTVLIADDDPQIVEVLTTLLEPEGYEIVSCQDGEAAVRCAGEERPDVILLDMNMPKLDGFQALGKIRANPDVAHTPVVMITGEEDSDGKRRAYEHGADEFVTKPPQVAELKARVRSLVRVKTYHDQLHQHRQELENQVAERTQELESTMANLRRAHEQLRHSAHETTMRLARAAEFKDEDTGAHIRRMSQYTATTARTLGYSEEDADELLQAATMHDVGKIGVPEKVLLKPGKLTQSEWAVMKRHTTFGARILAGSESSLVQLGERIARSHHEKWDGTGYPAGLSGNDIPEAARIVAVSDVFDALTSERPYKKAFPVPKAIGILREERGSHFDPHIVDAFLDCRKEILEIKEEHAEDHGTSISRQLNEALPLRKWILTGLATCLRSDRVTQDIAKAVHAARYNFRAAASLSSPAGRSSRHRSLRRTTELGVKVRTQSEIAFRCRVRCALRHSTVRQACSQTVNRTRGCSST